MKDNYNGLGSQMGYRCIPHGVIITEEEREKLNLSNNGRPWTEQDDRVIAVMYQRGATSTQVALALKRTTVAVQTRVSALRARAKSKKVAEGLRNRRVGGDPKINAKKVEHFALSIRDAIADKRELAKKASKKAK